MRKSLGQLNLCIYRPPSDSLGSLDIYVIISAGLNTSVLYNFRACVYVVVEQDNKQAGSTYSNVSPSQAIMLIVASSYCIIF